MGAMCVSQKQKMCEGKNKNSLGRQVWSPFTIIFFVFFCNYSAANIQKVINND